MVNCASHERLSCIFLILIVLCILVAACDTETEGETLLKDYMICKHCGADVSLSNFLLRKLSPESISASNHTLFNTAEVLVQELINPIGTQFKVILVNHASCSKGENWKETYSWFPGFAWKVCVCPKCSIFLGWMFEPIETATPTLDFPTKKGFYALSLGSIISDSYLNSLLMTDWIK